MANELLVGPDQDNILALLVSNETCAPIIAQKVSVELFSTRDYQRIVKAAFEHLAEHHKPIGVMHLRDAIEKQSMEAKTRQFLNQVIDAIKDNLPQVQPDVVMKGLDRFIALRHATLIIRAMEDKTHVGDLEGALRELPKLAEVERAFYRGTTLPNAADLMEEQLPPVTYLIDQLIPAGITIVAGPPKIGKSWLVLNIAIAIASGKMGVLGHKTQIGSVLYYALEDNKYRLKKRIQEIVGDRKLTLNRFRYLFETVTFEKGFAGKLTSDLRANPDIRVVIVDILELLREPTRSEKNQYAQDIAAIGIFKRIVAECGISIILVHHTTKGKGNTIELVRGTFGLTGSVDTIVGLTKHGDESDEKHLARLQIIGRDLVEEVDQLVELSRDSLWQDLGPYGEGATPERRESIRQRIVKAIRASNGPMRAVDIAQAIGKKEASVWSYLSQMAGKPDSPVINPKRGMWDVKPEQAKASEEKPFGWSEPDQEKV